MAATAGRNLRIWYDADGAGGTAAVAVAGARTESLTFNNEAIDITDKDDAGVRTLLDDIGTKSMDLSCEGVLVDNTLIELAHGATTSAATHTFEIEIAGIRRYTGLFFISSFEASGAEGTDPVTFTMSLQSSGAVASAAV